MMHGRVMRGRATIRGMGHALSPAVLSMASLLAQQPCTSCGGALTVVCPKASKFEAEVIACSVAAACRTCEGAGALPCPVCKPAPTDDAMRELVRRRELARALQGEHQALVKANELGANTAMQCRSSSFLLLWDARAIGSNGAGARHAQMHECMRVLGGMRARVAELLDEDTAQVLTLPLRIAVVVDEDAGARMARSWCGLEWQGQGVACPNKISAVVMQSGLPRDAVALHGVVVHAAAHLLLGQRLSAELRDELGYGWLDAGFAHWCEAEFAAGARQSCCVLERLQAPREFQNGNWRQAVRAMVDAGTLPALSELLAVERSDLDLAQHAIAFAFVDFLVQGVAAPVTHDVAKAGRAPAPLRALVDAARRGERSEMALAAVLHRDLAGVETAFREFVRAKYEAR
jgi:hypothetical protein